MDKIPPILEVGGILISSEILTEYFCCDYEKCKGVCCVEGSDGAPVLTTKNTEIVNSETPFAITTKSRAILRMARRIYGGINENQAAMPVRITSR